MTKKHNFRYFEYIAGNFRHFMTHFRQFPAPEIDGSQNEKKSVISGNFRQMGNYVLHFQRSKIQIYADKFIFQNIYLAGSKGFWGTLNCLKSKNVASARFLNQNNH